MVDARAMQHLLTAASFCAHVALCSVPGAGAWLTAPPVNDGREIDTPLFRVALKRRIRAPVFDVDTGCPRCGEILDRFGDHAMTCQCGGDRTIRHNAVRNVHHAEAVEAGLRSEREKAGLLPARPSADGMTLKGNGRRPADVWLPRGVSGASEAWDFAVTSGMQSLVFRSAAAQPEVVFQRYEQMKREYKSTARICTDAGFHFVPLVYEAHAGGWSPLARATVDWLAKEAAASHGEEGPAVALRIAQRISATLHRENARAILRRSPQNAEQGAQPSGWDEATEMAT